MRIVRSFIIFILLLVCFAICYILSLYKLPIIAGVWRDVSDPSYMLEFFDDGTYIESRVAASNTYTVDDEGSTLTLNNPSGDVTRSNITRNFRGAITVLLDGDTRTLEQTSDGFKAWEQSQTELSGKMYRLMDRRENSPAVTLYSDSSFRVKSTVSEVYGRYTESASGDVVLYYDDGSKDTLYKFGSLLVMGKLDSSLSANMVKENAIEYGSIQVVGSAFDYESGASYEFQQDNICYRTASNGVLSKFIYSISVDGLVTLVDAANAGVEVNLYYDRSTNSVYRFVFEPDSWNEYIGNMG